jgi:hypothetical protein
VGSDTSRVSIQVTVYSSPHAAPPPAFGGAPAKLSVQISDGEAAVKREVLAGGQRIGPHQHGNPCLNGALGEAAAAAARLIARLGHGMVFSRAPGTRDQSIPHGYGSGRSGLAAPDHPGLPGQAGLDYDCH